MDKQTHVNIKQPLTAFTGLTLQELEHMADCDYCMEQFADYIENQELLTAPRYLKEDILKQSRQFEVQIVAKSNQASKQLELFYYALKVGFAAAFAIVFLVVAPTITGPAFSGSISHSPLRYRQEQNSLSRLYDGVQQMTDRLFDITSQFYKAEVTPDDK